MKISILCLFISLTTFFCSNDAEEFYDFSKKQLLLRQLSQGDKILAAYTYTSDSLIHEVKQKWFYTKYHYQDGQLLSIDHCEDASIYSSTLPYVDQSEWINSTKAKRSSCVTFEYNELGKVIKTVGLSDSKGSVYNDSLVYRRYSYQKSGRVESVSSFINNRESKRVTYTYDRRGNVSSRKSYMISGKEMILVTTKTFEYDKMKNPYYLRLKAAGPGRYTNPNNVTKRTFKTMYDEVASETEYRYTYNLDGYPDERYIVGSGDEPEKFVY